MKDPDQDVADGRPPFFSSWTRLYAAVLLNAVLLIALAALFSRWPF